MLLLEKVAESCGYKVVVFIFPCKMRQQFICFELCLLESKVGLFHNCVIKRLSYEAFVGAIHKLRNAKT